MNYDLKHVAIILDGNRRWAKQKNKSSIYGHKRGADNLFKLAKYILKNNVSVLSVFAFSTENFKRSDEEVSYLMDLFSSMFKKHANDLNKQNIKVVFSSDRTNLRDDVIKTITNIEKTTKNNTKGILNICLNYGGHNEMIHVIKKINSDLNNNIITINDINENIINKYLYQDLCPIDLLIRTGGEQRISNFMLWQLAYSELYFTNVFFPDFNDKEFDKAVTFYNSRNRRFGGNSNEDKSI